MKTSAILCAVLAGTFGFTSVASADEWRGPRNRDRDHRVEQRHDRQAARAERRENRREWRDARREARAQQRGHRDGRWQQPRYVVQQPRYVVQQPRYVYAPSYRSHAPRFQRGTYLPHQYRQHTYYVNDWHAYPGLYAPPYGHQWVQVGSDFLLVALATGLIANLLIQ
jgi:Ni/Co efflux regulator RcnB